MNRVESNVIFGDVGGFYSLKVKWCGCQTGKHEQWRQLLKMGYVAASFRRPQTAFSTRLFERVHLELVEGHGSMKGVCGILKRLTEPNFPERVDNRYVEFMRVYRWYRDLVWTIEGGGFHEPELCDIPGGLALFCTSCAQPGVNLFEAQADDPSWLHRIYVTMDGDFKMEQLKQRSPESEVRLRDGQGFLVGREKYMEFLERTEDWVQPVSRSTCNDFHNQDHADVSVDHLMWRGIASLACARHGLLNNPSTPTNVKIKSLVTIYDLMCQYKVKLLERLKKGGLTQPRELQMLYLIGKFHLGGHKDNCWAEYTLDLLLGSGRQDGEILESLWSTLNKSKSTVRAMSDANRQEFLDDLIQDSNWKKLVGGGLRPILLNYCQELTLK
ncbi:hypothetical protein K435DRAFT_695972 [Dendrothele bispora CBS 962.96]|uniref:CxC2-like cysteine cluster KDZ transposase-associated domain-containing protein n=1 Tax=Dendrothele bispora (strain CBS 962.96) TaxID=1314807 RepID=A0A4S8KWT3_DENBC|nr:hypothetical protein K435DRAFT_695972 [Dendrothele bispora CBS 962.96]